jgi:pimeloyl-ACP methyl ester carboxylesterase
MNGACCVNCIFGKALIAGARRDFVGEMAGRRGYGCGRINSMERFLSAGRLVVLLLSSALGACSTPKQVGTASASVSRTVPKATSDIIRVAEGQRVAVRHYGDPNGSPLFFFHGWPSDASQGQLLDAAAKAHGFHVLAVDRPGFGKSDAQPGRRLTDWPPIVAAIADHYGYRRFAVSGVSGGGPYALVTGWALPQRVSSVTVVSCATPLAPGEDPAGVAPHYRALLSAYQDNPDSVRRFFRATKPVLVAMPTPVWWLMTVALPAPDRAALSNPSTFATVCAGFRNGWRAGRDGVFEDAALNAKPWGFPPEKMRVPVTFWHGAQDRNFRPASAQHLASRVPGAQIRIVENEAHFSLPLRKIDLIVAGIRR